MSLLEIKFQFPNWKKTLKLKERQLNLFLAAQIQTNRGMIFDKEGAHNGRSKWKGLAFRNGQILSRTGTLRKSIAPFNASGRPGDGGYVRFEGEMIKLGTNLLYARMMNDGTTKMTGGVLRPVRAKALKIPLPGGKWANDNAKSLKKSEGNFIFRKSVKIPSRPFDDWNEEDQNELDVSLLNEIARVLNGTD
jgi:phage gpG-like protein